MGRCSRCSRGRFLRTSTREILLIVGRLRAHEEGTAPNRAKAYRSRINLHTLHMNLLDSVIRI
jgi:hypothetical protein